MKVKGLGSMAFGFMRVWGFWGFVGFKVAGSGLNVKGFWV